MNEVNGECMKDEENREWMKGGGEKSGTRVVGKGEGKGGRFDNGEGE